MEKLSGKGNAHPKVRLYMITNSFPYGKGEKSFIMPELPFLTKEYDVTILTKATKADRLDERFFTKLENIPIRHLRVERSYFRKLWECFTAVFRSFFWKEIFSVLRERTGRIKKLYEAISYMGDVCHDYGELKPYVKAAENEKTIFYTYWYTQATTALILHKKKNENFRVITRLHGCDLYNERTAFGRQPCREILAKELDGVFFVCEAGRRYFTETFMGGKQPHTFHVCRLGVKRQTVFPNRETSHSFRLISCSNVIMLKRVDLLVRALGNLPKEIKIEWVHFGDGDCMPQLQKMAEQLLGGKENIQYRWMGHLDNAAVLDYYQNNFVDCFITASSTEGSPVSIQEALSFGIPIIGTDVGGISEMIDGNGVLLPETPSVREISEAIEKIYFMSRKETDAMREKSYRLWEAYFDNQKNANAFVEILCAMQEGKAL